VGASAGTPREAFGSRFLNFDGDGVCLALRQYAADGHLLNETFSPPAAAGKSRLTVESLPLDAAVRAVIEPAHPDMPGARWSAISRDPGRPLYPFVGSGLSPDGPRCIAIGGKTIAPYWFHAQNFAEAPPEKAIAEARQPAGAGVPVITFNAWFPGVTRVDATETLAAFAAAYPDKYFMIRLWLGPPQAFFDEWPEEKMGLSDGRQVALAPPSSARWLRYTRAALARMLLEIRCSPSAPRLVGVVPLYYLTGEWQVADVSAPFEKGAGFVYHLTGNDAPTREGFTRWLAGAGLPPGGVPSPEARRGSKTGALLQDQTTRAYGDFHSASVASAIVASARNVKDLSGGKLLAGVFYGYLLEHPFSPNALHQLGHLGIGRVLDSPDVDFVGSPYSYSPDNRFFGKPIELIGPADSYPLHGKAAFIEDDTYTHKAEKPAEGLFAPGEHHAPKNLDQTMSVLIRNWAFARIRGYQIFYMSLLADGRFNLPEFWGWFTAHERYGRQNCAEAYRPVVAAVVSPESLALVETQGRAITARWLYEVRSSLARAGTSVGYYLQSDLPRIPDSVRCLVLLTPYAFTAEEKEALATRWKRDGRVIVFCHAPAIWNGEKAGNPDESVTGIGLALRQSAIDPLSEVARGISPWSGWEGQPLGDDVDRVNNYFYPAKLPPVPFYCEVSDSRATPLAVYSSDKSKISCAYRKQDGWTSVFLGSLPRAPRFWQELIRLGNGHLYLPDISNEFEKPDFVDAGGNLLLVQSATGGTREIRLPGKAHRVLRIDTDKPEVAASDTASFRYELQPGRPTIFEIEKE